MSSTYISLTASSCVSLVIVSPTPSDFAPALPNALSPSHPFISFKGEGSHLILGYLPISVMTAPLIIRSSIPSSFLFYLKYYIEYWRLGFYVSLCKFKAVPIESACGDQAHLQRCFFIKWNMLNISFQ